MGIYQELISYDDTFHQKTIEPVIVNDYVEITDEQKRMLNDLIYSSFSGDVLNNMPSCYCGVTKGKHKEGIICPECGRPVEPKLEKDLEPLVWLRAPE